LNIGLRHVHFHLRTRWICRPVRLQQQPQGREGGQLEGREEQLGTGREERRRGSCRTAAMEAAAAAGQER